MVNFLPSNNVDQPDILPFVTPENMKLKNDIEQSANMGNEQMPPWWQNSHAIQERFADVLIRSAAEYLMVNSSEIQLVPGGAGWLDDSKQFISFVVMRKGGTKHLVSARFENREIVDIQMH